MKAIVLSSGGIDSTTCLSVAVKKHGKENVVSVSVIYGQKHDKEIECAREIAEYYGIEHYEINLTEIMKYSNCSLLKRSTEEIEHRSYCEQISKKENGMVSTYVPFRNGLILSSVSAIAMSLFPDEKTEIYIGVHADDSAGNAYADCSPEFIESMNKAICIGTYEKVEVKAPFVYSNKTTVVKIGHELKTPYELTWSCYEGKEKPCGTCGTCIDRKKAFKENGLIDPV